MPDDDRLDDLLLEWEELAEQGRGVSPEELCRDCPELVAALRDKIAALKGMGWVDASDEPEGPLPSPHDGTPSSPPPQILAGRFRLEGLLGGGGFGRVWRAFDQELHRQVAVKVSKRGIIANREQVDAFLSEARKVARLKHACIVPVYDVGRHDQSYFIVSELIDGEDLSKRMGRGRLPVREALRVVAAVAYALEEAHSRGIVHQDIKPSNVLLGANGRVYLSDFGIALDRGGAAERERGVCGTVAYMSPEQAGGDHGGIDGRSDIYSLGVLFCELVTGIRPPPSIDAMGGRGAQLTRPLPHGITPPTFLHELWGKCLATCPDDRYATAKDLAEHLRKAAAMVMEEEEWATSTDPMRMLAQVQEFATPRKLRLFVCGCFRLKFPLLEDPRSRLAVEAAERDADGEATEAELAVARAAAWEGRREHWAPQSHAAAWATNRNVLAAVFNAAKYTEPALQCHVLRELFGPSIYLHFARLPHTINHLNDL